MWHLSMILTSFLREWILPKGKGQKEKEKTDQKRKPLESLTISLNF